jgi:ABC-type polysaccharide/polyol phosphate transport system ATPase subunit
MAVRTFPGKDCGVDLVPAAFSAHKPRELIKLERVHLYLPFSGKRSVSKALLSKVGGTISRSAGSMHVNALRNVHLELASGDRVALFGHNGAGKTSLMRVMSGIYEPSAGKCTINGRVLALFSTMIGLSWENTGRANIRQAFAMFNVPKAQHAQLEEEIIEFSELGEFIDLPINAYSAGMGTRLGFSIISSLNPDILIIDEVLSAGDMSFSKKSEQRILGMIDRAHALVVASHSADFLRLFCNRGVWMERGQVRMDGPFEEVWQAYYASVKAAG